MTQEALFFSSADVQRAFDNADYYDEEDEYYADPNDPLYSDGEDLRYEIHYFEKGRKFGIPTLGEFEIVGAWHDGSEYGGPIGWIAQHTESGRYFARTGEWGSYDGGHEDDVVEVTPKEVLVTRFFNSKDKAITDRDFTL